MSRILSESRIGKYLVLKISDIPLKAYNKIKIGKEIFNIVPMYDSKQCIAIESKGTFLNENIEFLLA